MKYRLVVLTHGENAELLVESLMSFSGNVSPKPVDAYLHVDGPAQVSELSESASWPWLYGHDLPARGFCNATRQAWLFAQSPGEHEYVFWLEHDFVFTRGVNLDDLARVLDDDSALAQMALMRDAVNETEQEAGGLYESRRDEYVRQTWMYDRPELMRPIGVPWMSHRSYFTTNPSLMRRDFMQANPFPPLERECEGLYGLGLVDKGYHFGVWGSGEPWVRHIGARTGFGY